MDINKTVKLSNASGVSVVVLNAFNSSTNVVNNSTQQGYQQELQILPLASGKTLGDDATTTATLDGTYVDSKGQTKPTYIYDLLVSKTDSLFPVMAVGEALNFSTMSYPDIAITATAAGNMQKALSFCTNIMTAPSSKMSVAFQSTLNDAFKTGTVADGEAKVASFFNQYDVFKGLDFVSYVAVSTWLRGFAYLWGMNDKGQPGMTYYVYSAAAAGKTGATSEGTITFVRKPNAPSPADPADRQSAYTITLVSSSGSKTALTFDNGQLIDSQGGAVALNCAFSYKGTFTGKDTDTTAITIFSGTLLNKQVMVIPMAPESGWDKFWSDLSFQKLFSYFMQAMGLWMALDFLKQKLAGKNEKLENDKANENQGKEPTDDQVKDAQKAGENIGDQAQKADQQAADRVAPNENVEVPANDADFANSVTEVRASGSSAFNQVATDKVGGAIDSGAEQVSDLAQIEMTESLQEAEGNLVDAKVSLSENDIPAANESIGEVNVALPDIVNEMGNEVSADLKAQVEEAVQIQEEASEISKEASENSEDTGNGEEEPFEDTTIPEI
ncbi:hypothetical protein NYP20_14105 [Pseudomonas sp. N3-W]|uniref:Uncharacterized protein n=1 Tax=Pseudomonas fungipugnans TaxID=3024217 RepID=A0ABT6QJB5_9PSED|nr:MULTISPECIES: hypothetical protein [unclassified Pseudomonas]MDI2590327.1 hypothetical protein [Pseudomonas sp. 681]UWF52026.1 hypothetical protein NYP20_14105 [Pseudomonas sp. N3-W]